MKFPTCICGECSKCKHRVYMAHWREAHRDEIKARQRAKYALNPEPKREEVRQSRLRRIDKVRAYDRARGHRGVPEKDRVRRVVSHALRDGLLLRDVCEVCGGWPTEAHHDDYSRPLDVRWLCKEHHGVQHRTVTI